MAQFLSGQTYSKLNLIEANLYLYDYKYSSINVKSVALCHLAASVLKK